MAKIEITGCILPLLEIVGQVKVNVIVIGLEVIEPCFGHYVDFEDGRSHVGCVTVIVPNRVVEEGLSVKGAMRFKRTVKEET